LATKEEKMEPEVRFYHMIPDEVVRRRKKCPIAYLPVGALEWHGSHLPFGTDCITVEHIAIRAAQTCGGIAFPVMTYGDVRYMLHDCRREWHKEYCQEMKITSKTASTFIFREKDVKHYRKKRKKGFLALPMSLKEQQDFFAKLIAYTMMEIYLYGFKAIILLPGHGPNRPVCIRARKVFMENARCTRKLQPLPVTRSFFYIFPCEESEPRLKKNWIHADKWESSVVKAIAPKDVHPERLPKDPKKIPNAYLGDPYLHPKTGYSKKLKHLWENFDALDPRRGISAKYGRRQIDCALKALKKEVREIKKELKKGKS